MKSRLQSAPLSLVIFLAAVASAIAGPTPGQGDEPIASFVWDDAIKAASPVALAHEQTIDPPAGMRGKVLKISNPDAQPLQVDVLTINHPAITADFYALRGQVRYDNVAGDGYLEMWNFFPGGGQYFSRTLGNRPGDPMAKLSGTSDWRPILLPFNATGSGAHPEKLSVNVVLPGHGTVYLTALQLFQIKSSPESAVPWTPRAIYLAGASALTGVGVWAAWGWRRRYRTAEWRRMAALDT